MKPEITYPPVEYLFFDFEQPSPEAWEAIGLLAEEWNETHNSKFITGESEEWGVVFSKGIQDPEFAVLKKALRDLKKKYAITWFLGVVDNRKPADFEKAPFVEIVGNSYPSGFVVNHAALFAPAQPCRECGIVDQRNSPLVEIPVIDESFLDQQIDPSPDYTPPGLDLVTIDNGLLLISKKTAALLDSNKIKGYELSPVLSKTTGKASDRIFLLRATQSILRPCNVHTPETEEGICSTCGRIKGGLLNYFFVRQEWLGEHQLFSRHVLRYDSIYLSNKLYHIMKKQLKGMLPADGIFACSHE